MRPSSSSRPPQPIPAGTDFKVVVNYVGRPGVRVNPSPRQRGLVQQQHPGRRRRDRDHRAVRLDGLDAAQQPRVGQADLRRPLDGQLRPGRRAGRQPRLHRPGPSGLEGRQRAGRELPDDRLAHVQLALGRADRAPTWSRTASATSTSPSAWRTAGDVIYYEYQSAGIAAARKATNKAIMDMQEDITHFQEQFNGPFPFNANGIVIAPPERVLRGGDADEDHLRQRQHRQHRGDLQPREHAPVVGRQRLLRQEPRYTFFKEGYADLSQYLSWRTSPARRRAPWARPRTTRRSRRRSRPASPTTATTRPARTFWSVAPTNPTSGSCSAARTRTTARASPTSRCGRSSATTTGSRSTGDPDRLQVRLDHARAVIAVYHKYLPNQSKGCHNKLDAFFKQWWDTATRAPRRPATSRRSRARAWPATTSMTPTAAARTTASTCPRRAGGDRPGDAAA